MTILLIITNILALSAVAYLIWLKRPEWIPTPRAKPVPTNTEGVEGRRARGYRAKAAMEEFFAPAMDVMRDEYMAALTKIAANEPWETAKMTKLAVAQRVIDTVYQHAMAAILDGEMAAQEKNRAEQIAALPEAKRKWL